MTGGLPVPSPPQADEINAIASANTGAATRKPGKKRAKAREVRDIDDDMRDMLFVITCLLAVTVVRMLA